MNDETKLKILADFASGATPSEVQAAHDVSYATALRYKREFDTAVANGTIAQLIDVNSVVLKQLADQVVANAPDIVKQETKEALGHLITSLDMADTLKANLQASANKMAEKISALTMQANSPSELIMLSEALCMLQNAFFNKAITQVNVQNNYGDPSAAASYGGLLNDMPE